MIDRRKLGWIVLLALIAAASQMFVWLSRPRPAMPAFTGPPRSDYTLTNFSLDALDEQGKLAFTITGPRLTRRGDDGSIFIATPDYTMAASNGDLWRGESESAWVNKDGSRMLLQGRIEMRRDPLPTAPPITIVSANMSVWPKQGKLESAAATRITQTDSILQGTGMRCDLNTKVLELLSDVDNRFEPRSRRQ